MALNGYLFTHLLVVTTSVSLATNFLNPLPEREKLIFREEIRYREISQLEQILQTDTNFNKKLIILDDLGRRADKPSRDLLETFAVKMKKNTEAASKDAFSAMLYAGARVNIARVDAGGSDSKEYIGILERLLSKGDAFMQQAIAQELGRTGSNEARAVLQKYERVRGAHPALRIERLKADFWHLDDESFVKAILDSARLSISKGDTRLIAEGSVLVGRAPEMGLSSLFLEAEVNAPKGGSQAYRQFVNEMYKSLQECENRYCPGFYEAARLYNQRDIQASTALEQIYLNKAFYWSYRQKAYEMHLTIELERRGLSGPDAARYLISQLSGTGDGHSSDWETDGQKTLDAIKNAATVRKMIQYGATALVLVEEELKHVTSTPQTQRLEALTYVRTQIERVLQRKIQVRDNQGHGQ